MRIMSIPLFVYGLIEITKRMHSKVLKYVLNTVGGAFDVNVVYPRNLF